MVLGWIVAFDLRKLEQTANRHGLSAPKAAWRDLLTDYRNMGPAGRHTPDAVANRQRVATREPAHRALSDCRTALAVMRAVVKGA